MTMTKARSISPEDLVRYRADVASLTRTYPLTHSPARVDRLRQFYEEWLHRLDALSPDDVAALAPEARTDAVLLRLHTRGELHALDRQAEADGAASRWVPFRGRVDDLVERHRRREPVDSQAAARTLTHLAEEIGQAAAMPDGDADVVDRRMAAGIVSELATGLEGWFRFYHGYDPLFTWWVTAPYRDAAAALQAYSQQLGHEGDAGRPIVGRPIGRAALLAGLADEVIPYTPEELVDIAWQELAWCEREMRQASQAMGCGDDWQAALERVKNLYAPPGGQPAVIDALAAEGVQFAEQHDLVTIPALAKETWRTAMMSPERQRINPFFLGGEVIRISYPTDTMSYAERMMSMRGNNPYFSRSTVFHELLPGHYLQQYMAARWRTHRQLFHNPFWVEGLAFYWEMRYWDLGFNTTPEQRVGMLFWRMHRSARVIYTIGFHLGQMTPEACVAFLTDRVGHEPDNARGEVRRLFEGGYGPLYQCAYLIGALQFRALHREMVAHGPLTERQFHDEVLQQGRMPIEVLRAVFTGEPLPIRHEARWRFYEDIAPDA